MSGRRLSERALAPAVVAGATAAQAVTSAGTSVLPAVAPLAAASLGVAPGLIGLQVSILYGFAALAALVSGRAVRRFGAVRVSQATLALVAAGAGLAAVPSLSAIAAASVLLGLAYGLPGPAASHLLARHTSPARRNLIFSIKQTGVPLGGALAGLFAPPVAQAFGWQAAVLVVAVAGALLATAFAPVRAELDDDRDPGVPLRLPIGGLRLTLRHPALRRLAGVGFLLAGVQVCVTTFVVTILVEVFAFRPVSAGLAMAAVQAAGAAGRIGWGLVADWGSGGRTLVGLAAATAALAAALLLVGADRPGLALAVFGALGATAVGWNGVFLAEVARLAPPGGVGEATSALLAGTYLGVFVGPALFGALAATWGYGAGYAMLAAASAPATLLAAAAGRSSATGRA